MALAKWTVADTRNRILEYLQRTHAGEVPTAEDAVLVDEAIESSYDKLLNLNMVQWPGGPEDVPNWAKMSWRNYVAGEVICQFGLDAQRRQEYMVRAHLALRELRSLTEMDWNSQPVESRFY